MDVCENVISLEDIDSNDKINIDDEIGNNMVSPRLKQFNNGFCISFELSSYRNSIISGQWTSLSLQLRVNKSILIFHMQCHQPYALSTSDFACAHCTLCTVVTNAVKVKTEDSMHENR